MRLPQVSAALTAEEVCFARGTADALALNPALFHTARTHSKYIARRWTWPRPYMRRWKPPAAKAVRRT